MLINVSMTMVVAPMTFLWDGHWHDPSTVPGGRSLLIVDLCLASWWPCVGLIGVDYTRVGSRRNSRGLRKVELCWIQIALDHA